MTTLCEVMCVGQCGKMVTLISSLFCSEAEENNQTLTRVPHLSGTTNTARNLI